MTFLMAASNSEEYRKCFQKTSTPKKVNRPSDRKFFKKSEPYLRNEPFPSYGPKNGFQKRA